MSDVLTDQRNTLTAYKTALPETGPAIDNLLAKLPNPKTERSAIRPPTQIPRQSSPGKTSASSNIPAKSMDDLKKRLEMIKKRSKPT